MPKVSFKADKRAANLRIKQLENLLEKEGINRKARAELQRARKALKAFVYDVCGKTMVAYY